MRFIETLATGRSHTCLTWTPLRPDAKILDQAQGMISSVQFLRIEVDAWRHEAETTSGTARKTGGPETETSIRP
ncbi:hypothetical protein JCM9533A_14840 [Catenuloplanes niger JCM 9533]